ncbi:hypothetical protein HAX54_036288 [Datura stramonium]|uniref:AT-hook motif nuclear-localized protein n=1 Tax=Datura stramonium TaxID=4076 RepID=A0ABS8RPH1_DATST|nr:hypothetical protein [Datura stramonium]
MVNPSDPGVGGISATTSLENPFEKGLGKPMRSRKQKQLETLRATGFGAMPHVIKVGIGEDIAAKIMTFSQQGKRAVYILSAFGVVCNATIQQPAVVGDIVTYEGQYRIVSLSGSFLPSDSNDSHSKTGGMIVSLAGLESSIICGGVVGKLVAGSPVQVVLSSFVKPMSEGPSLTPPSFIGAPVTEASSPLAGGIPSSNAAPPMHDMPGQTM